MSFDHQTSRRGPRLCAAAMLKSGSKAERRQDRDILKQEDTECRAAVLGIELATLGQQLQRQGG